MRSNGAILRELLSRDEPLFVPGVHDPLTASVANELGVDAIYMTGYGTSLSTVGYPDAGLITMPEMIENANAIQERIDVPLIADADNGYGNATNVVRTVREYAKTGVGAIHIEDQTFPKRCGHVAGKEVVPRPEAIGKIRAAADVRDERDRDLVLIARTDVRGCVDGSLSMAIDRANDFVAAGADVAFVEGPADRGELERVVEEVDAPVLYNFVGDLGSSPYLSQDELAEVGVDLVIFPVLSTLATIAGVHRHLETFVDDPAEALRAADDAFGDCPVGGLHEFSGFPQVVEWEERYMPRGDRADDDK